MTRARILAVAGTFVLTSGLVYFAFMSAWLELFLVIGFSRVLQVALALLALLIAVIHLKDFVAPGEGVSLSIPQRAKPGLYARVRAVVNAQHLAGAVAAVAVLAVMVNMLELLCTAGLPALYTQVLSQQMTKDFLLVAYGHQPDRYRSSLRGTSQAFEQKLLGLLEGDFDQLLLPPPTPEIRAQLGRVQQVWRDEYRPLIDRAVDREELDSLTIARISRASRNLFREIGSASQLYRGL